MWDLMRCGATQQWVNLEELEDGGHGLEIERWFHARWGPHVKWDGVLFGSFVLGKRVSGRRQYDIVKISVGVQVGAFSKGWVIEVQ